MKANYHNHKEKAGIIGWIKSILKPLPREVTINYLAHLVELFFNWIIHNWITVFIPSLVFIVGLIIKFAQNTYSVSGLEIIIGTVIALIIVIAGINAPKIRKWVIRSRDVYFEYGEFYWKKDEMGGLIGPFCKTCGMQITQIYEEFDAEMERVINEMFGETTYYTYWCNKCDLGKEIDVPLEKLKIKVLREISVSNPSG